MSSPRRLCGQVGETAPEIDDEPAVQVDGDGRARFPLQAAHLEAPLERLGHRRESRLAESVRLDAHRGSMRGNPCALLFSGR